MKYANNIQLVVLIAVVLFGGCASPTAKVMQKLHSLPEYSTMSTIQIPYPILLLHGLGQKADVWNAASSVKFYQQDMGLNFGGTLNFSRGKLEVRNASNMGADFFTVSFSSPTDSVGAWARELDQAIDKALSISGANKVILIGYSMGGLTARYHLLRNVNNHRVKRLVSIGSPHQGSAYAKVYNIKHGLNAALADNPNPISKAILNSTLYVVNKCESDVPFDSYAVRDLRRPEDGGVFLQKINNYPHPGDVEYISIVGEVDILNEVKNLNAAAAQDILRRALSIFGNGTQALFEEGDGVVSAKSQTIAELPWFKNDKNRRRISRTISLKSVHTNHLQNSSEIQKLSLEEKPELKATNFYLKENQPVLSIDFVDYFPAKKIMVEVGVKNERGELLKKIKSENTVRLVKKSDGTAVFRAECPYGEVIDWNQPLVFEFTISNSFGVSFSSSVQWYGVE